MIPALVVARSRRWRLLIVASLAVVAIRILGPFDSGPPGPRSERTETATYRVVPLTGDPVWQAGDRDCLPFLDEVRSHPGWQLTLGDAWSSCTASGVSRTLTISAGTTMSWDEPGMPTRQVPLTDDDRAAVFALDELGCARPDDDGPHYGGTHFVVAFGTDLDAGASVATRSPMGHAIATIFDGAIARYVDRRAGELRDLRLDLAARSHEDLGPWRRRDARYRVTVGAGHRLQVARGRKVVLDRVLDPAEVVDLADWALHPGRSAADSDGDDDVAQLDTARGWMTVDGARVKVVLAYRMPPALDWLETEIQNAIYEDVHPGD